MSMIAEPRGNPFIVVLPVVVNRFLGGRDA